MTFCALSSAKGMDIKMKLSVKDLINVGLFSVIYFIMFTKDLRIYFIFLPILLYIRYVHVN